MHAFQPRLLGLMRRVEDSPACHHATERIHTSCHSALQSWARRHGGFRAALTHPQAPPEGPLRDALAAVLRQGMASTVAYDAG